MFISGAKLVTIPFVSVSTLTVNTEIDGVRARKTIVIVDRITSAPIWKSLTNNDGSITRVVPGKYATTDDLVVTAFDETGTYNAVVSDKVRAQL